MWQSNHKDPLEALMTGLHGEQLKPVPANSHQVPKVFSNNILSPAPTKPSDEEEGSSWYYLNFMKDKLLPDTLQKTVLILQLLVWG